MVRWQAAGAQAVGTAAELRSSSVAERAAVATPPQGRARACSGAPDRGRRTPVIDVAAGRSDGLRLR